MLSFSKLFLQVVVVMAFLGQPLIAISAPCKDMTMHASGSHILESSDKRDSEQTHHVKHGKELALDCCDTSTCNTSYCLSLSQIAHTSSIPSQLFSVKISNYLRPVVGVSYLDFDSNSFFRPPISLITG
ncbi:MAG TPA: hypothetical protein ENI26_03775 [Methylophaga aminisulfidivorans]|uniref:Uncharacterized protein n=2 Tax=root TaxID=1 RepID=A0A7C1W236_9GAMM|nr:hypothetical protein [Methylophaga aminisulfidivorans]